MPIRALAILKEKQRRKQKQKQEQEQELDRNLKISLFRRKSCAILPI
jgi:hypothetical protein